MRVSIVLDCADPEKLSSFWMQALEYVRGPWPHEPYVVLVPPDGKGPLLILQRVEEPKSGKNRMHLDYYPADIEAEARRVEELGATRLSAGILEEHGARWIVLADPEGNEFCVCSAAGTG